MAMLSVSLLALAPALQAQQLSASQSNTVSFNIPAQPLTSALSAFARQSGVKLAYPASLTAGKSAPALSGQYTPDAALSQLLSGSGLSFSFTAANVATISDPNSGADAGAAVDGAIALDTIDVSGGGIAGTSVYTPYETAASTAHISAENIERFRGASPADMFRGTPGVMSGEARNGGAGIDVNIRGMQGFGRVATTVDGAENNVTVYQGYQGLSNRTFVDPDFIGGVDITKGADAASWGNAGSVAMRTINADDIVKEGNTGGVRVKGGFGTNTSRPNTGDRSGYLFNNPLGWADPTTGYGTATPSATGMDRPGTFTPTSGSGSVAAAYKGENFDVVAGYAYREQGNYHAGTQGNDANPISTGERPFCYPDGSCPYVYRDFIVNGGLANYRAGEEVLNTQLRTESWLAKLNAKLSDEHTLQLGYTGFRSEAGDRMASALGNNGGQAVQQKQTAGTSLDTFTARHRWNPADNDLIQMNVNAYWSHLELRNPIRGGRVSPEAIGLPANFRTGSDSDMWGSDFTNLSKFAFDFGKIDVTNGFSYRAEDTRGSRNAEVVEGWLTPRDAIRHEVAGFTKVAYSPVDWLTLNGALRYSHFWTKDRADPYERTQITSGNSVPGFKIDDGGFSPSAGVMLEPLDGAQLYVNYSNTMRAPSVIESVSAFNSVVAQHGVRPERSSNWELGANLRRDGLLLDDDRGMIKLGYFNWDVKDYLARNVKLIGSNLALNIENIDRAKFEGLEFSGRYEHKGFSADLAANYFLNVEYCRTADTCSAGTLYGDYATNHVQPKYTVDLTVAQKLFEDALTVGGRASYVGPRAIGHGDVTAVGASQFIAPVNWEPYVLVDLFSEYKLTDSLTASLRVENVFDKYYVDPLSLVAQPGPGRTFYASFTKTFGGDDTLPELPSLFTHAETDASGRVDWGGLYAGFHAGAGLARTWGTTTAGDGTANAIAATESADRNFDSGMFGVQAGYNWQLGNGLVLGLEADLSKTYMQGTHKARSTEGTLADAGAVQAATGYDVDWTASLRGRIGYAVTDRLMLYGTGGLSMLRESQTRQQFQSLNYPSQALGKETQIFQIEKDTKNRFGFTVGVGAEYAVSEHWSIRADYGYTRFGAETFSFDKALAGAAQASTEKKQIGTQIVPARFPPTHAVCRRNPLDQRCFEREEPVYEYTYQPGTAHEVSGRAANNALDMHTLKLGINYRF
ncbi:Iron siderophore receptor protein [Hyphomicrobium sulfonivorans]|uniref:Iron siderophore receptor protein n=1 Tax=Hyphomicrobium sulfonivorans TaxID=121290 RepID=A0A109BAM6_HYPSL|nr:TonB-dependent receptor [Hyphomicrobium sulfonivorans]KWT65291.1 Iron siderophore receptor protein [Hyphomicrobium sulfonivorans]